MTGLMRSISCVALLEHAEETPCCFLGLPNSNCQLYRGGDETAAKSRCAATAWQTVSILAQPGQHVRSGESSYCITIARLDTKRSIYDFVEAASIP